MSDMSDMSDRAVGKPAFWIDSLNDRDRASEGESRYALYVRDRQHEFVDLGRHHDDVTVPFAVHAWKVARGPIMSEPFVFSHPCITEAVLWASEYDGGLILSVDLITPLPKRLERVQPHGGGFFHGWSVDMWGTYIGVSDEDVRRGPYLLGKVTMLTAISTVSLAPMTVVPTGEALQMAAHTTVRILVPLLNRYLQPVINGLQDAT